MVSLEHGETDWLWLSVLATLGVVPESSHDRCSDETTPEEDVAICDAALAEGDPIHAAFHIASALSGDPLRSEWRARLEQILEMVPEPLDLFAPEGETGPLRFGVLAAHAYALAHEAAYQEALELLFQIAAVRPEVPYLAWALEWLDRPGAVATLDPERTSAYVGLWLQSYAGLSELGDEELAGLRLLAPVLDRILEVHDTHVGLLLLGSSTLRKVGRCGESVSLALRAYDLEPGWRTAASVAMGLRAQGCVDTALTWYEGALTHDPEELTVRLDLGDMLCEARRVSEATRWYREVLEREPDHPWASASLCFLEWLERGDEEILTRLADLASMDPPNHRALRLLSDLVRGGQPYVGYIPEPSDATINFLREIGDGMEHATTVTLSTSSLEAPSTRLVLERYLVASGLDLDLELEVKHIQEPDPRRPSAPVEFLLWEYEGTIPVPAVDPPLDPEVIEAIEDLAQSQYDRAEWVKGGRDIAQRFGRPILRDLLGMMVHPPPTPSEFEVWDWVRSVQFACMVSVAGIDEGWAGSLRREVLRSLLHGPMDWTVEAAAAVLGHLAADSPEIQIDVLGWFLGLIARIPRPGHCCYEAALLQQALSLEGLSDTLRAPLGERLSGLLMGSEESEDSA